MSRVPDWSFQAKRIISSGNIPHFAPAAEALDIYREHLEIALAKFGQPSVLILGATPELSNLAISRGCKVYRVDKNPEMFDAALARQQYVDHSEETLVYSDWLNMDKVKDNSIDLVMGDAALNQIPHCRMNELFHEIRRITHKESLLSFKQIVIPDMNEEGYNLDHTLELFRAGRLSETEFYKILRFYCFLDEAYDPVNHILDAAKVFAAISRQYAKGKFSKDEFDFLHARHGTLKHTVYKKSEQCKMLNDQFGNCLQIFPKNNFVYENIYNMFLISIMDKNSINE